MKWWKRNNTLTLAISLFYLFFQCGSIHLWIYSSILTFNHGKKHRKRGKFCLKWWLFYLFIFFILVKMSYLECFNVIARSFKLTKIWFQDKNLKCTVYKITGSIPAGNYIQIPKTSSQSLGLTGRYLYLLFKPVAGKYFVVHMDVATQDGFIVRVSFSNLFKEFKSTSTWLQFPFVCHPSKGSVSDHAGEGNKGKDIFKKHEHVNFST